MSHVQTSSIWAILKNILTIWSKDDKEMASSKRNNMSDFHKSSVSLDLDQYSWYRYKEHGVHPKPRLVRSPLYIEESYQHHHSHNRSQSGQSKEKLSMSI